MSKILLSIVVPTKDRYDCLKHLIALIASFKRDDIELIVQDNTYDNTDILKYLGEFVYLFVKYYHTKEQLSVCDNSDLAILHANGEYICFIGDDDGVTPTIMEYTQWMKTNQIDSLVVQNPIYTWPGVQSRIFNFSGTLLMSRYKGIQKPVLPMKELQKVLALGGVSLARLPRVYQGIVSKKVLNQLYEKCKTFFPGPSPDMANAVALAFLVDKCYFVDAPIIISGQSKKSGAGMGASHKHKGEIENVPFLPRNCAEIWERDIPKIWTGETVWAESCVKALKNMGHENLYKQFNLNALYAKFYLNNPKYAKNYLSDNLYKKNIVRCYFVWYYCFFYGLRISAFVRNVFFTTLVKRNKKVVKNLNSIQDVSDYLVKNIQCICRFQ